MARKFEYRQLAGIAVLANGTYHPDGDPPYVALLSGRGEVQLGADGSAFYLNWYSDHAVHDVIDLDVPEEGNIDVIANWLINQAEKYEEM